MKSLFDKISFGTLELRNRIIRSATFEMGAADNGKITDLPEVIYTKLAENEVGLIITGMMGVGENSRAFPGMIDTEGDSFVSNFSRITSAVHQKNGKIAAQLAHCGVKAGAVRQGTSPYGPSDFAVSEDTYARGMTKGEIEQLIESFGTAAAKCREAGADAVEIHAAHGYLLSQFLSPYYNKRTDEYGGSVENRARLLIEIYEHIRECTEKDFPILVKINGDDLIQHGFTAEECLTVCTMLLEKGLDAIEVSSGLAIDNSSLPFQKPKDDEKGTFTDTAAMIADKVSIPIISVGGYRTIKSIENALNKSNISAISMSRPFICEPCLVKRWHTGDTAPSKCTSCNGCFGEKFACVQHCM